MTNTVKFKIEKRRQVGGIVETITNAYREASQMPEGPERTEALVMFHAMDDQSQGAVKAFKVACPSALVGVGL